MQSQLDFDWRQVPFLRLLVMVLLAYSLPLPKQVSPFGLAALASIALIISWAWMQSPFKGNFRFRWVAGSCLLLAVGLLAAANRLQQHANQYSIAPAQLQQKPFATVALSESPFVKNGRLLASAQLTTIFDSTSAQAFHRQGILLKFDTADQAAQHLKQGDVIAIKTARIQPIYQSSNPGTFDYRSQMAKKSIYFQKKIKPNEWLKHGEAPHGSVFDFAARLKKTSSDILLHQLRGPQQAAFASALLLGDRSQLDPTLVKAYASSGAIHVLAVSGLHVGIFYMLMHWIGSKVFRLRKWTNLLFVLLSLWTYALVTGLPASVSRACTMFSLVAIGKEMRRESIVYNTIAAAAFLLLWFKPTFLHEIGFQLSFAAVVGIVYLQPKIYKSLFFKRKWLDWLWQLTSVSLAAQVFTFPLSIYYFHQFPNYFLLSNFVVIPLAAPLLLGSLLLLAMSPFPTLAQAFALILGKVFDTVNFLILQIEALPGALTAGFRWTLSDLWLHYALLLSLCGWLAHGILGGRRLVIGCLLLLVASTAWRQFEERKQQSLTLYEQFGTAQGSLVWGHSAWVWGQKKGSGFDPIDQHLKLLGVEQQLTLDSIPMRLWQWDDIRVLHLRAAPAGSDWPEADLLIVSHQPDIKLLAPQLSKYKLILLDSSNSPYYCRKLGASQQAGAVFIHSVALQGAITLHPWTINTYKPKSIIALGSSP